VAAILLKKIKYDKNVNISFQNTAKPAKTIPASKKTRGAKKYYDSLNEDKRVADSFAPFSCLQRMDRESGEKGCFASAKGRWPLAASTVNNILLPS
jgi:hypothetical protein